MDWTFSTTTGDTLRVSSVLLHAKSGVFRNCEDTTTVRLEEKTCDLIKFFTFFYHFNTNDIDEKSVCSLARLSHKYDVPDLLQATVKFIMEDMKQCSLPTLSVYWQTMARVDSGDQCILTVIEHCKDIVEMKKIMGLGSGLLIEKI